MIDHNYQQEDTFIDNAVLYTVGCEGASGTVDRTMPWQRPNWDLHINRPSVYLDRWVWIRLARAANGAPQHTSDLSVLDAVQAAADAGVAFPLSATHYLENTKGNQRQRVDIGRTMASISRCRTLCSSGVLVRHQMLRAMHVRFGRPAFRPRAPRVLGIGVWWALEGKQVGLSARGSPADPSSGEDLRSWLRRANQFAEMEFLIGARDGDLEALRSKGYRPEAVTEASNSRLEWERLYVDILASDPITRDELRVRVLARELIHEHLHLMSDLLQAYHLDLNRALRCDPKVPGSARDSVVELVDQIPSLRVAADLKVELFRDPNKTWKINAVNDIDALSLAIPYCHVVMPDREMTNLLSRSRAAERNGTVVLAKLPELPDQLAALTAIAEVIGGDVSGWDWAGPGEGWHPHTFW